MGAILADRIRIQLAKGQSALIDSFNGGSPSFVRGTDIQLECAYFVQQSIADLSNVSTITVQFKSTTNIDGAPLVTATATSGSTGWNTNPVLDNGDNVIPSYATYGAASFDAFGGYTVGVQIGGNYTWTPGVNDLTISVASLVPSGTSYTAGSYTLTGLTIGKIYYWNRGTNDTQCGSLTVSGFFIASGTSVALTGAGTITCQVCLAMGTNAVTAGSLYTTGISQGFSTTNYAPSTGAGTITGLVSGQSYYWTKGANDSTCGSLTASGYFTASGTTQAITGLPSAVITAIVYPPSSALTLTVGQQYAYTKGTNETLLINADTLAVIPTNTVFTATGSGKVILYSSTVGFSVTAILALVAFAPYTFIAASNTVTLYGSPLISVTASLVGSVGWNEGSDQHFIVPIPHTETEIIFSGSSTQIFLVVSAALNNGNELVLGSGNVNVVDDGFANDLIPGGTSYNGSGNYVLSGLTIGVEYVWTKGVNDLTCPPLNTTGVFIASGTSVTLTGTANALVTATVGLATLATPIIGVATIGSGVSTLAVTINASFIPTGVLVSVMKPSGQTTISATARLDTLTQTGFNVDLSSSTPATGYSLTYYVFGATSFSQPAFGTVALSNGVSSVVVSGLNLGFTPSMCIAVIMKQSGASNFIVDVDTSTLSSSGFTAEFSGATDSANYVLAYLLN